MSDAGEHRQRKLGNIVGDIIAVEPAQINLRTSAPDNYDDIKQSVIIRDPVE